jgi:hypothetical protein
MQKRIRTQLRRLIAIIPMVALLTGCGGGSDGPDETEREEPFSEMVLTHVLADGGLQAQGAPIRLKATGGELSKDLSGYVFSLNRDVVNRSIVNILNDEIILSLTLIEGKNQVTVFAPDSVGNAAIADFDIWSGSASVMGRVLDETGRPVSGAVVVASLGDDPEVNARTVTDTSGNYRLNNFPAQTVLVDVTGPSGLPGTTSGVAGGLFSDVILLPFGTPVSVTNNDFRLGTEGWIGRGNAQLSLVPHVENPGPAAPTNLAPISAARQEGPYEAAALSWYTSDGQRRCEFPLPGEAASA